MATLPATGVTPLIEEQLEAFFREHYKDGLVADVGAGKDDKVDAALRRVIKKEPHEDPSRVQRFDAEHDIVRAPLPWSYHHVVTCDMLEHCRQPFLAARNIVASVKPGGWLYATTVFAFEHHEYPVDLWRFTTTALEHLFAPSPDGLLQPFPMYLNGLCTVSGSIALERCWYEEESPHPDFGRRWRVSLVGQRV